MKEQIKKLIQDSIEVKQRMLQENTESIQKNIEIIISAYKNNKKVVIFGNGGSAVDAMHFAGELVVRFEKDRKSLAAVALSANPAVLTAIGNDYGYDKVFSRQVESIVNEGDIVIGISTSGKSKNIILALEKAREKKAITITWTGKSGGELLKNKADFCLCVPSNITARIQEGYGLAMHIICKLVEEELFK